LAGVRRLPDGRRKAELQDKVFAKVQPYQDVGLVLGFDAAAADCYASILATREKIGLPISMADAQIAAICLTHQATCATRNTKDFAHTGVSLIDPWTATA
jgi:predicted nucleic acid-binding protein